MDREPSQLFDFLVPFQIDLGVIHVFRFKGDKEIAARAVPRLSSCCAPRSEREYTRVENISP